MQHSRKQVKYSVALPYRQLKSERPQNPCPDPWWIPGECQGIAHASHECDAHHCQHWWEATRSVANMAFVSSQRVDDMRAAAGEERIGSRSTWDQCQEFFDKFEYTGARQPIAAAEQLRYVAVLPGPSWCSGLTKRLSVSAVKYLKKCGIPIKEVSIHDHPRSDRLPFAVMTSMSVSSSDTAVPISQGKVPKNKKGRRLLSMLL